MRTAIVQASQLYDYVNACKLILPQADNLHIILAGCGGTGSWLAPALARIARLLIERDNRRVRLTFYDPDVVERKNVYRQNFCDAEVGRPKAEALAYRYGLAWGVEITAAVAPVRQIANGPNFHRYNTLNVFVGCVDTPAARAEILSVLSRLYLGDWWLDCGNEKHAGQVVIGGGKQVGDPWSIPGFCSTLPLPSERHPNLVEAAETPDIPTPPCLSCADMLAQDAQGLTINQLIASIAAGYLLQLLVTKDLERWGTYVDAAAGSQHSEYILRPTPQRKTRKKS